MKYTASKRGEFPTGTHWTAGESRELELPEGVEAPAWLKAGKASKAKKKTAEG